MKECENDTDREKREVLRNPFYYHAVKHKAHTWLKAGDQQHVLWHGPM
jgi:hypothetical protein